MELRGIYEQMGGNYDDVISRLHADEKVEKYLLKFLDYHMDATIREALNAGDFETAFRESHNLKGVCANLSLDALAKSASALTEALRGRNPEGDINDLVEAMERDYATTVDAINCLK